LAREEGGGATASCVRRPAAAQSASCAPLECRSASWLLAARCRLKGGRRRTRGGGRRAACGTQAATGGGVSLVCKNACAWERAKRMHKCALIFATLPAHWKAIGSAHWASIELGKGRLGSTGDANEL